MSDLKEFFPHLSFIVNAVLGLKLLQLKNRTGWWYLLLLISWLPLFSLIVGAMKADPPNRATKLWSYMGVVWGIINLLVMLYLLGYFGGM